MDLNDDLFDDSILPIDFGYWNMYGRAEWIFGTDINAIPESLWNLDHLLYFELDDSPISSISENIENLSNLKEIHIGGSLQLTSLPETIGNLNNLLILDLSGNAIEILPENIVNLSSLEELVLSYNQLSSLPDNICNLNTWSTDVSNNQLCEEYHYDCIDDSWDNQDQSNCCDGENGEPNWTECPECELGDINCDGNIDVLDVVQMIDLILTDEYDEIADINED